MMSARQLNEKKDASLTMRLVSYLTNSIASGYCLTQTPLSIDAAISLQRLSDLYRRGSLVLWLLEY